MAAGTARHSARPAPADSGEGRQHNVRVHVSTTRVVDTCTQMVPNAPMEKTTGPGRLLPLSICGLARVSGRVGGVIGVEDFDRVEEVLCPRGHGRMRMALLCRSMRRLWLCSARI